MSTSCWHVLGKVASAALLVTLAAAPARAGFLVTYDPGLGTLPQAQSFVLVETGSLSPPPSISGGTLNQGLTAFAGEQYWQRGDMAFNFDSGFTIEGTLRVLSSTYNPNANGPGSQRSGYYLEAVDELGRRFTVGIDSGGVTVNTDSSLMTLNGIPRVPFDTTDGFHNYRVVVAAGVGSLFIDGTFFGVTPVGPVVDPTLANRVLFGDQTTAANSQAQLSFFQYGAHTVAAVPEPSTFALLGVAAASFTGYLRRRRRACSRTP